MRILTLALSSLLLSPNLLAQSFVNYESPQVHPIANSADGTRLFVLNTPDNRLAIYSTIRPVQPVLLREVFVGLEPVSVRPRTAGEVWVVNYLSDSISIVSVAKGVVTATIRVKDEPTDVAFAGSKAFVSVSGSDEVRVFDTSSHKLLGTIPIFGDEPRNLVVSADAKTVWVVVHRSGNDTTILETAVAPAPPKPTNRKLRDAPQSGLIIDSEDPTWTSKHSVVLPDYDLVEIDVATMKIRKNYAAVGTINSGAALRPGTNEIWIANTDARNLVRFVTKVRGHALDNRVTRVTTSGSGSVTPFDLNPSINYGVLPNSTALSSALAQPKDVVWDAAGKTMFVAAFGTDRIGIVDPTGKVTGFIEVGNTAGTKVDSRNKRGPRGLALHSSGVLYVLNRLSNSISAIDTSTKKVLWELGLFDPTPSKTKQGRGFLYDAKLSGNATFSCGSCHVDGDTDGLAWDLGDPGGDMFETRSGPTRISLHPMKGPMLTQTLKGLKNTGPFHWRGDKPKLQDFNGAFDTLMGKTELATADMDDFAAFMETILFPPNPNRTLSDKLATKSAMDGENLYTNVPFAQSIKCISCHVIPTGTNRIIIPGSILKAPQSMKTAQLRNIYKRTGFRETSQGRKSGFGLTHDGEKRDSFDFLGLPVFNILSNNTAAKLMIQDFLEAFPTESAPAVGYQVTVNSANVNSSSVIADVGLLQIRAEAGDIDLIVKGQVDGRSRGMLYQIIAKHYLQDSASASPMTWAQISALIKTGGAEFTLTGVAPGTGKRSGIDRDADGVLDRDEGVELYGFGTKGCAGTPFLGTSSAPYIGNKLFSFVGRNAMSKSAGFLAVGLSPASFSLLGITVLVDITKPSTGIMSVFSDANGELALPLPIPNDIALVGLAVFNQIAWSDNCASQRVSATQGLKITITK